MAAQKKPVNQRHGFRANEFIVYPAHGVGQILAVVIWTEIGSIERFNRAEQLASYTNSLQKQLANLETATNVVLDAAPRLGERGQHVHDRGRSFEGADEAREREPEGEHAGEDVRPDLDRAQAQSALGHSGAELTLGAQNLFNETYYAGTLPTSAGGWAVSVLA